MRDLIHALAVLAVVLLAPQVAPRMAHAQNLQEIAATAERSTARILTRTGRGSGFVVAKGQGGTFYVVTNQHVVQQHKEVVVAFGLKDRVVGYLGQVINVSAEMDLALVRAVPKGDENHSAPPVPLATRELIKGEDVFALGFPGATDYWVGDKGSPDAFETTLTRGLIAKVTTGSWSRGGGRQIELVQHTASINKGNSGGPLFNYCGQVMGVNTAGLPDANDSYVASSSNTLAGFLRAANVPLSTVSVPCDPNNPNAARVTQETPEVADGGAGQGSSSTTVPVVLGVLLALGMVGGAIAFGVAKANGGARASGGGGAPAPSYRGVGSGGGGGAGAAVLSVSVAGAGRVDLSKDALAAGATIGRDDRADIPVKAPKVSREHARLSLVDRRLTLTDLGSTNGTEIDGAPLAPQKPTQINTKSVIVVGGVRLSLSKAP